MTHRNISWTKSLLRFGGYIALPLNLEVAAVVLIAAELLGILEEVGQ